MNEGIVWQRIEGAVVFVAAVAIYMALPSEFGLGWAVLIFFAPDLSFAAYLAGPKAGGVAYNITHVYALGAVLLAIGLATGAPGLSALGALWLGHSGFDRMLGYGLKLSSGFKDTHLGRL